MGGTIRYFFENLNIFFEVEYLENLEKGNIKIESGIYQF